MTTYTGKFCLDGRFTGPQQAYLKQFSHCYRRLWDEHILASYADPLREAVGLPVGPYGLYYTGIHADDPFFDWKKDPAFIGFIGSRGPKSEDREKYPILKEIPLGNCQWAPTADGTGIEWTEGEKFHYPVEWLRFLIRHFVQPWGYTLTGSVTYERFDGSCGTIHVEHNHVSISRDRDSLKPREPEDGDEAGTSKEYWLVAGYVSPGARQEIVAADGWIKDVPGDPPVSLVKLTYDPRYYRTHGKDDLALFFPDGLSLSSKQLDLDWRPGAGSQESRGAIGTALFQVHEDILLSLNYNYDEFYALFPRSPGRYWLAVGTVTKAAQDALMSMGTIVHVVHQEPQMLLLGLPLEQGENTFEIICDTETILFWGKRSLPFHWKSENRFPFFIESVPQLHLSLPEEKRLELL